ncbi:MAG: response regulator [Oscillospiraceae bacterium]|nr:response regulator [Oscillospiraceae bacterium]
MENRKTVFIVDDNITNLTVAEDALSERYRVIAASSAAQMFKILEKHKPDLILLDIEMPGITGFDAMKKLKADGLYSNIPVIFLTGLSDNASEASGIELGAVDFIAKPFSKPVLINRIKNHLDIDELIKKRTSQLVERTEELELLKNSIVYMMADIVESRDKNTGGHVDRTAEYAKILIGAMLDRGVYADQMKDWNLEAVILSARLHDVGKIAISDSILNKPGPLTKEEFEIMKTHAVQGKVIIENAVRRTGDSEFLQNAMLFAAYHHERWNGTGYPYGLKETEIPLHGRIMAVIDVYDALVSERPYKKAFSHEESVKIIADESGKHFDPAIARVFCDVNNIIKLNYKRG